LARLPDGTLLPWAASNRDRTFDERLYDAALEDMFAIPYETGPIIPVTTENHDPGRIRVERLFEAVYGRSERGVALAAIRFAGHRVEVHTRVKDAFLRVGARLQALLREDPSLRKFVRKVGGTFVWRPIAGASLRSSHSYGIAIDLDPSQAAYWRWDEKVGGRAWHNTLPQTLVDGFESEGFIWGGRWYHYDTMHFEYRPELLDGRP